MSDATGILFIQAMCGNEFGVVSVKVSSASAGFSRETETDSTGFANFDELPVASDYVVKAWKDAASGTQAGVVITAGQATDVIVNMM